MPRPFIGQMRAGHPAARYAAPVAAAVALGLSLGTPYTVAVAAADSAGRAEADTSPAPRTTAPLGRKAADRGRTGGVQTPKAAAAVPGPAHRRAGPVVRPRATAPRPATRPLQSLAAPAAAPDVAAVATAPAAAMAAVRSPVAAVTSSAVGGGGLLAQFKAFFGGGALLLRRSLFNKPPTVNPVQLTGQSGGPITGTIGAVDPEGDALTYKVTADPSFGTVTVGQDGSYSYSPGTSFVGTDNFVVTASDSGLHINLFAVRRSAGTIASVSVTQGQAAPQLRFQFNYGSGAQFWSPEARSALESAAAKLASYFVVTAPVTLTFDVTGQFSPLSPTLASAGSDFADPRAAGFMKTIVQNKIQTGSDGNGSAADGTISWNFGSPWTFGNTVSTGKLDFQGTAMHELLHTFGFLSNVTQPGTNSGTTWTLFDSFVVDSAGNKAISGNYKWDSSYNPNLIGRDGGLYFNGPNAVAANRGPVSLYTPNPWESGSSLSHLNDMVFFGSNDQMMNAKASAGSGIRTLSAVELGILRDIGYNVVGGTPSLMLVGLVFPRGKRRKD